MLKQSTVQKALAPTDRFQRSADWQTPVKTQVVLKDLRQNVRDLRQLHARLRFMMNEIESIFPKH